LVKQKLVSPSVKLVILYQNSLSLSRYRKRDKYKNGVREKRMSVRFASKLEKKEKRKLI